MDLCDSGGWKFPGVVSVLWVWCQWWQNVTEGAAWHATIFPNGPSDRTAVRMAVIQ